MLHNTFGIDTSSNSNLMQRANSKTVIAVNQYSILYFNSISEASRFIYENHIYDDECKSVRTIYRKISKAINHKFYETYGFLWIACS